MKLIRLSLVLLSLAGTTSLLAQNPMPKPAKTLPKGAKEHFGCHTKTKADLGIAARPEDEIGRGTFDNYFAWDVGQTLYVKFLPGGSQFIKNKMMAAAKEWERYANIKLVFVESGDANIRVQLTDNDGCWSVMGSYASSIAASEKTMNIDTGYFFYQGQFYDVLLNRTTKHEFGHAIGLHHEHFHANKPIKWNKEQVYKDHEGIWTKEEVDAQIFRGLAQMYTNGTAYDPKSIMHYPLPARWTTDGFSVGLNTVISEGDKQIIGMIYPFSGTRSNEVPRFAVISNGKTEVVENTSKNGLSIYPKFTLTTKGNSGTFILIAYILDENGNAIVSKSNPDKYVAVVKSGKLNAGLTIPFNKGTRDFEMFIPYDELPAGQTKFRVLFITRLYDDNTGEVKNLNRDEVRFNLKQSVR
jgi:serralysin